MMEKDSEKHSDYLKDCYLERQKESYLEKPMMMVRVKEISKMKD